MSCTDFSAVVEGRHFMRKVSTEKTDECTVWDSWDELWMESDEDFRERIERELEGSE